MLSEGVARGRDAFHTFTLATCCQTDGVSLRSLVLRGAEKSRLSLYSHTDSRSEKISQLSRDSRCSLLFYDPVRRIQIRLQCRARIHAEDEVADFFWNAARLSARKSYLSTRAPGEVLGQAGDGLPSHLQGRDPGVDESQAGRKNFVVIQFLVESLDWLFLSSQGHRRARFHYDGNGFEANWTNP